MKNRYWSIVENDIPRFLAQLDGNPISPTFGSFDRSFWHHRRTDFSSAALQQGVFALALLYSDNYDRNLFYQKPHVLTWIEASLKFTFRIQHQDGSMDEWYPQERGWAGPTGYVLYSVIQTLELVGQKLDSNLIKQAKIFAEKAVHHLLNYEESDVLANHQAMAILATRAAKKYFNIPSSQNEVKNWRRFSASFSDEGWSLEYDGCDPGYQTATLSFLSRLYQIDPSEKIKELCEGQLKFLSLFLFPDNSFAGSMGSRGTTNVFHFGFEYWAKSNDLASHLAEQTLCGIEAGILLRPCDQEDHYLIYRLVEFLESARIEQPKQVLPWAQPLGNHYYNVSSIFKIHTKDFYGLLNLNKNGAGRIIRLSDSKVIFEDSGYFFEDSAGLRYSSSFVQKNRKILFEENKLVLEGSFNVYRRPVFSQFSFWLFRTALLFVHNSTFSRLLKIWIRAKIMTKFSTTEKIYIRREITFAPSLKIIDTIQTSGVEIKKAYRAFYFPTRSVPQSLYFSKRMIAEPTGIMLSSEVDELNLNKKIELVVV